MTATFKIGDKAVYPSQGVTEVVGIESKEISGNVAVFYVLTLLNTQKKILVPLARASDVGLRRVINGQEVEKVYQILHQREIPSDNQTWNRRYRRYLEKIKTGSVYDVAEVMRDLHLRQRDKPLSFGERKMLDTARTLLVQELAVSLSRDPEELGKEIETLFE